MEKTMTMNKIGRVALLSASALALALVIGVGAAEAESKKKGPRAGLAASTTCAIVGDKLEVSVELTDNSSGGGIVQPHIRSWEIEGLAKTGRGNWDEPMLHIGDDIEFDFDPEVYAVGVPFDEFVNPDPEEADIVVYFDLCNLKDEEKMKAVSGSFEIKFTRDEDFPFEERTVENMCTDTDRDDGINEGGQKMTAAMIDALCP